jgi:hypothetical protein
MVANFIIQYAYLEITTKEFKIYANKKPGDLQVSR